jgi:hypothetical protein
MYNAKIFKNICFIFLIVVSCDLDSNLFWPVAATGQMLTDQNCSFWYSIIISTSSDLASYTIYFLPVVMTVLK